MKSRRKALHFAWFYQIACVCTERVGQYYCRRIWKNSTKQNTNLSHRSRFDKLSLENNDTFLCRWHNIDLTTFNNAANKKVHVHITFHVHVESIKAQSYSKNILLLPGITWYYSYNYHQIKLKHILLVQVNIWKIMRSMKYNVTIKHGNKNYIECTITTKHTN